MSFVRKHHVLLIFTIGIFGGWKMSNFFPSAPFGQVNIWTKLANNSMYQIILIYILMIIWLCIEKYGEKK